MGRLSRPAFVALLLLAAVFAAGCGIGQPQVVSDIVAASAAVVGQDDVMSDHFEGDPDGWLISVIYTDRDAVRDAVLAVFDGRGYSVQPDGATTRIADTIVFDPGDGPEDGPPVLTIWVPTDALGADGYPAP